MSKSSSSRKKARPGLYVRLLAPCPVTSANPDPNNGRRSPLPEGAVAMVAGIREARRTKGDRLDVSGWGTANVLELHWNCECCGATLTGYIPQSWVREGKAVRVSPECRSSLGATTFGRGYCHGVMDVLSQLLAKGLDPQLAREAVNNAVSWLEFERACSSRKLEQFRRSLGEEPRPASSVPAGRGGKTGKLRKRRTT